MEQQPEIITPDLFTPTKPAKTNWDICALCQKNTKEKLMNNGPVGYKSLSSSIQEFSKVSKILPLNIDIQRLNNGSGIENTLASNQAKWHKSCNMLFSDLKLDRARKQSNCSSPVEDSETSSPVKTRRLLHS